MNDISYQAKDAYPLQLGGQAALMPTLKGRLEGAVRDAEQRLAEAKRAREILNAHPELEELLNIMQKGRF
jgi:hypothetical protein